MRLAVPAAASPASASIPPPPLLLATFCLSWSSAFSVTKLALTDCPPLLLLTARLLIGGLCIFGGAAMASTDWRHLSGRDLVAFGVLGILNALYLGLYHVGMRGISSGLSALIVSANPVLTAFLATMFLDERMTLRKATGLSLGVAGVAFIVERRVTSGLDSPVGIILTIGALMALVTGTILFKRLRPNGGLLIGNGVQNLVGGLALVPFAFAFESPGEVILSGRLIWAILYSALFVSVIGYLCWFHLLTTSGATAASAYHFLMPPLGMLFGHLLLGEHVALTDFIGIVPVVLGIYLVTRPPDGGIRKQG